jgi:hypothetical protein
MSKDNSNLVWAIPIDFKALVSSIEAYQDTKSVIDQFIVCNTARANRDCILPPEIVDDIAKRVRTPAFKKKLWAWKKIEKCAPKDCIDDGHTTLREREREWQCNACMSISMATG